MQAIRREGVTKDNVGDVLPLDQHVRLADGVGLGVQLLPMHDKAGFWVDFSEVLLGNAQHATCTSGGIIETTYDAGFGESLIILDEEEVHHEADDFTRGEVFPGSLVGKFGKLADQLLEHSTHLSIADDLRVKVDVLELLGDEVEQAGFFQLVDLGVEFKTLKNVPHVG